MDKDKYVRTRVLGASVVAELPLKFFSQTMKDAKAQGRFVEEPPPFIAPCSDGLLVVFNVFSGPMALSGHAARVDLEKLKRWPTLEEIRKEAPKKPMTLRGALLHFGFPQPS